MGETWKQVPRYPGAYEVSSGGSIRSVDRIDSLGRWRRGKVLKTFPDRDGYLRVRLSNRGKVSNLFVHRIVCEAFHGPPTDLGQLVLHGPEGVSVNTPSNVRWGSHADNARDRRRDGTDAKASQTHCVNGHTFSAENTYFRPTGQRTCRTCHRERSKLSYQQKRDSL